MADVIINVSPPAEFLFWDDMHVFFGCGSIIYVSLLGLYVASTLELVQIGFVDESAWIGRLITIGMLVLLLLLLTHSPYKYRCLTTCCSLSYIVVLLTFWLVQAPPQSSLLVHRTVQFDFWVHFIPVLGIAMCLVIVLASFLIISLVRCLYHCLCFK